MYCESNIHEEQTVSSGIQDTNWRTYSKSLISELKEKLVIRRAKTLALLSENNELTAFNEIDTLSDGLDDTSTNMTNNISPPAKDGNMLREALDEHDSLSETSSIVDSSYANGYAAAEHEFKHTKETSEQEDSRNCCECCSFSRSITSLSQDSITSESSSHEPEEAALCGIYKITSSHKLDAGCNCFEEKINNQMIIKASTTQNSPEGKNFLEIYRENPTSPLVLGENESHGTLLQSVANRNMPLKTQSSTILKHAFAADSNNLLKSLSDTCFIQESLPAMNKITSECTTLANYLDRHYCNVSQMIYESHDDFGLFLNKRNQESCLQFTSSGTVQDFEAFANIVNNFDDYLSLNVNHSFDEQLHYDDDAADDDEFKCCAQDEADNEDKEKDYCEEEYAEIGSTFIDTFYNDSIDSPEHKKESKQAYFCNIIDQFQSQNETSTSCHAINSVSKKTYGTDEMFSNATTSLLNHGNNHISVPDIYDMLEEMAHIFESNPEFYNAISKELKSAFEAYFASQTMACEANRNKSGNSGYNLTPTNTSSAVTTTKQKNVDLAENSADNNSNLLACLEKARLVSILHGKVGNMTNRADNYAAVKAYEKSVTDFEKSMREYIKSSAENSAVSELLKHLPLVSFSETPAAAAGGSQEGSQVSEKSVLRRSNTFVVEETCTTKPPAKARRRKSCIPSKGEHSGKVKIVDEKIFEENEIDEITFVVDSESTKDPHSSPTFLVGENPLCSNVESVNVFQSFKMNDSPSSSKRCQMSTGFLQMDHKCDSDTSDSMSEPKESTNKIYTSTMLAKLLGYIAPDQDKTPDNEVESSDNQEIKKCNEQVITGKSSPISHLSSLKKIGINSILGTLQENESTCIDQATCKSPDNLLLKEKSGIKTDVNIGIEDQKFATDSEKSDSKLGKQFNGQERVTASHAQSSDHCNERLSSPESELSVKETLKLKSTINDDLKNASITKDKLQLDFSTSTKKIFSPEKKLIFHNAEENSLNHVRIFKCDTSPVTKPQQNAASSKAAHSKKKKSTIFWEFLGSKSKHTSSAQSSVKSPKKWQLPLEVKESDSQKHSSDTFVSKLDWSSSDEDAVDDNLYDKSPPGILHHTQKDDVKNKLQGPNQNSERSKKFKSSLKKRMPANWIKNYGNELKVNEVADVTVKSHFAREQEIEGADCQHKIKDKEDEMKVMKALFTDLNEGTNIQVLSSASQYLHSRAEEECTINERSLDTIIISQTKVQDVDKMRTNCVNKSCEETQEMITVCSSTSNTSDEYILPVSRGIVESKSENDIKVCRHDNSSFLIKTDSKHLVLQPDGKKGTREAMTSSYVSDVHTDVNIVAENHCGQKHQNTFSVAEVRFSAASHSALVNRSDPDKCNTMEVSKPNFCAVESNISFDCQTLKSIASEQLVKEISVTEPKLIRPSYPSNIISLKEEVVISDRNDLIGKKHEIKFAGSNVQIGIDKRNSSECLPRSQQVLETLDLNTVASVMVKNDIQADQMTMNEYGNTIRASAELLQLEAEGILLEKDRPEYGKLHGADLLSKFQTISDLQDKVDQLQRMLHLSYLTSCNFHHGSWIEMNKHPVKPPICQHQTPVQSNAHMQLCPREQENFPLCLCSSQPSTNNDLDRNMLTCNIHSTHLCRQQSCSCHPMCDHVRPVSHQESEPRVCQTLQNTDNSKSVQKNKNVQGLTQFNSGKDAMMKSSEDQLTMIHQNLQDMKRFDEHVSQAVRELDERVEQFTEQTTTALTSQGTCLEQLQVLILEGLHTIQASVSKQEEMYHSIAQQVAAAERDSEIKQQSLHYQKLETTMKSEQMVQEALLPLSEALSAQRQELEEVKSSTDRIVSYLEESRQEKERRGMDYDKMKERIVELTSQRDAEKVFHKITRQSLRALERDHERLRQEYVCAACRRYIHGNSDVQKRMWRFLNNHDEAHHYNDNQSNKGAAFRTSSPEGVRQEVRLAKHGRRRKSVRRHPYWQVHGNFPCHEEIPLDCCHCKD